MAEQGHGGIAIARALKALGVDRLFTLTGGHIFPILDGCHREGIGIVDTRHEQNAAFAAEGWARLTRRVGVVAVTAGPGVTNAMSALAQASFNRAPVLALGGRAPAHRWGKGSLQELDHVPFVDPIAAAATVTDAAVIGARVIEAAQRALTPPRGPRFLDFPLDVFFETVDVGVGDGQGSAAGEAPAGASPRPQDIARIAELLAAAQRPVVVAGSNVYLDGADGALLELVERAEVPVFMNGQGRGCVPADHPLAFARSRSRAFTEADLVVVVGTPLDFRLGFGEGFASGAKIVHIDAHEDLIATHVEPAASAAGSIAACLENIAEALETPPDTAAWVESLIEHERRKEDDARAELASSARPIHPMRVYGELAPLLDRDAIVIGDGGDFVSFAGREIRSFEPGCWLDPGPFGCLGVGPGYAMAARLAHSERQVVVLLGDGALGFSGVELESLVRHRLPALCVVGNNGIWGLEKHPMKGLFGYDVAADLQAGVRYDVMMEAFGGRGETVADPDDLSAALRRGLDSGEPYLVNVLTDPDVAYPRSANLA